MGRTCGCYDCQSSRGRRKEFRQSAGMPEDEVPRKIHAKGKNKKHVHTYEKRVIGTETIVHRFKNLAGDKWLSTERTVDKTQYVCTGCGNKKRGTYGRWRW